MFFLLFEQHIAILERSLRIVDGAGSNDDKDSVVRVFSIDYSLRLLATCKHSSFRLDRLLDFVLEEIWRCKWIVATDC